MLIAIPSKGRPGQVATQKILKNAKVYVPELEVADYEALGTKNIIGVPNHVKGITQTRNWILRSTTERWVVMVDDDVRACGWIKMHDEWTTQEKIVDWEAECARLFETTEDLKYRIWGTATQGAPGTVYPWKPFLFHSYVTASFMGIVNDGKTYFDERFKVKEDYELCLRCIKEDGGILAARYLYWTNSHWTDKGGCNAYRTQDIEEFCTKLLIAMYPGMIRRVTRGGSKYSIHLEF